MSSISADRLSPRNAGAAHKASASAPGQKWPAYLSALLAIIVSAALWGAIALLVSSFT